MSGKASHRGHKASSPKGTVVALIERGSQMRRWMVERDVAWLNRDGRLAEDFDASVDPAAAFLRAAPRDCSREQEVITDESSSKLLLTYNSIFLTYARVTSGLCFLL